MTNREAYIMGWVFGRINAERPNLPVGGNIASASARPYSALGRIISDAQRDGLLHDDLDQEIAAALTEINTIAPVMESGTEKIQPLEIQGSWQLGYYKGYSKLPIPTESIDIANRRKALKMTQADLAKLMGVEQAVISRWESGKVKPNADNAAKLNDILL